MKHRCFRAQDAESGARSARMDRPAKKTLELPREDFCVGCSRKRKCVRPRADEASTVYSAARTAEPWLLLPPRVRKSVDRFADDPLHSTELRDKRIDANEAIGFVKH